MEAATVCNALTIDVEDYFQVNAFRHVIDPDQWDSFPLRVVDNTLRILDWLASWGGRATFFTLGWVADRTPFLVREIAAAGHEIASHGYGHQLIYQIGPQRFREDVRRAKGRLEELCGTPVVGYRAPSYSITDKSLWALDILIEEGYTYDSSIFPVHHDVYGMPGAERFPHQIERPSGSLREFPISTLSVGIGRRQTHLPVGGGGYLRLFPASFLRRAFEHLNRREGQPGVLYFHPWEIDPGQPRIDAGFKSNFRHYLHLDSTLDKLTYLARHLAFAPMGEVLQGRDIIPIIPEVPTAALGGEATWH
jgi:polysaccharide deacetylase family protein (PEP-CTERM system associated)